MPHYNPRLQQPISAHGPVRPCPSAPVQAENGQFVSRGGVFEGGPLTSGAERCGYFSEAIRDVGMQSIGPYGLPQANVPMSGHRQRTGFAPMGPNLGFGAAGSVSAILSSMAPVTAFSQQIPRGPADLTCPGVPAGSPGGQVAKGGVFDGSSVSYGSGGWVQGGKNHACYYDDAGAPVIQERGAAAVPIPNAAMALPLIKAVRQGGMTSKAISAQATPIGRSINEHQPRRVGPNFGGSVAQAAARYASGIFTGSTATAPGLPIASTVHPRTFTARAGARPVGAYGAGPDGIGMSLGRALGSLLGFGRY